MRVFLDVGVVILGITFLMILLTLFQALPSAMRDNITDFLVSWMKLTIGVLYVGLLVFLLVVGLGGVLLFPGAPVVGLPAFGMVALGVLMFTALMAWLY